MKKTNELMSREALSSIELIEKVQAQTEAAIRTAQERSKETIKAEVQKIRDERKRLLAKVADIDRMLARLGYGGVRSEGTTRSGATTNITITDAVLKALEGGNVMQIPLIVEKASDLKGVDLKPTSVNQALMVLKKQNKVEAASRGQYKIRK